MWNSYEETRKAFMKLEREIGEAAQAAETLDDKVQAYRLRDAVHGMHAKLKLQEFEAADVLRHLKDKAEEVL